MASEGSSGTRYSTILLTGVVSLAVGVGTGLLLKFLTTTRPSLRYTVVASEEFSGQQARIGILAVQVSNPGKREVEDVTCRIVVPGAHITEYRVSGLAPTAWTARASGARLDLRAPYLNPGEGFTLSLLVRLDTALGEPSVDLRGRGVRGEIAELPDGQRRSPADLIATGGSALGAILSMFVVLLILRKRGGLPLPGRLGEQHSDDQRDVAAYVLGRFGLRGYAQRIRYASRSLSYWSLADELTEEWLSNADPAETKRGIDALTYLLDYASIAPDSERLIQLNVARLALRVGDRTLASKALVAAVQKNEMVIVKRIQGDDELLQLRESLKHPG